MRVFTIDLQVDFGDCDPAGIVFYPNFYRWFDRATHQMFREVGYTFAQLKQQGLIAWPLVDTGAQFLQPVIAGEHIRVHSFVSHWSRKSFRITHQIKRGEELLVDGFEVRILGAPVSGQSHRLRAVEIPAEMRIALGDGHRMP